MSETLKTKRNGTDLVVSSYTVLGITETVLVRKCGTDSEPWAVTIGEGDDADTCMVFVTKRAAVEWVTEWADDHGWRTE